MEGINTPINSQLGIWAGIFQALGFGTKAGSTRDTEDLAFAEISY